MPESLLKTVLAPLARFCIRRGLHFSQVSEELKDTLIQMAAEEIGRSGGKVTVSAISLMTGITRREVQRIYRVGANLEQGASITARIINRWQNDRRFVHKNGRPRQLSHSSYGGEFQQLCYSVSSDVNAGTVLKELERQQAVEIRNKVVKLRQTSSLQSVVPEKGMGLLMKDIETLCKAAEENIHEPQPVKNLHYRTEFDNIDPSRIDEIRKWLLDKGAKLHKTLRELLSKHDRDLNPKSVSRGGGRVVLGTFSWTQLPPPEDSSDAK